MTIRRFILTLIVISGVGVIAARSDDVVPAARQLAEKILGEETLPDFVGGPRELHFNNYESAKPASPAQEAAHPLPAAAAPETVSAASPSPSGASGDTSGASSGSAAATSSPRSAALIEPLVQTPQLAPAAPSPDANEGDAPAPATPPATAAVEPSNARPVAISVEPITPDGAAGSAAEPGAKPAKAYGPPAKSLFGSAKSPSPLAARAIGSYSRGCLSGGVALPIDGPAWQAMRLSRNRNWGHPNLVKLVERLGTDAKESGDWPGLLVGDLSQPRGGPMLTGHASHQVGLDADVWLTPMPKRKLTDREREDISATSMLDKTDLAVDPNIFTDKHVKLIKRAASYPQVERVLVHPAIKKALCQAAGTDRAWLGKVRPIGGHYYHFHIRISCPPGSEAYCKPQKAVTGEDGCGKEVDEWLARLAPSPPVAHPPGWKPKPPAPPITMADMPAECQVVLASGPDGIVTPPSAKPTLASTVAKTHPALHRQLMKIRSAKK